MNSLVWFEEVDEHREPAEQTTHSARGIRGIAFPVGEYDADDDRQQPPKYDSENNLQRE
jgi:hypothetical protein